LVNVLLPCHIKSHQEPAFEDNRRKIRNLFTPQYNGVEQILWVDEGIVGDDTDGHIDDTVRFVNEDTVLTVIEENKADENYELLQHNLKQLKAMHLLNGNN
jgi:agmatine deiminase